jgi:hypothetical protein
MRHGVRISSACESHIGPGFYATCIMENATRSAMHQLDVMAIARIIVISEHQMRVRATMVPAVAIRGGAARIARNTCFDRI